MQIKKLFLQNFRNYEEENFVFTDGLNILFGKNAQGKTNCAEAVFYLCTGASLRIRHDKQLVRIGAEHARIVAEAENRYGKVTIEANIFENKREIKINGAKISKNADFPRRASAHSRRTRRTAAVYKYFHLANVARILYGAAPL